MFHPLVKFVKRGKTSYDTKISCLLLFISLKLISKREDVMNGVVIEEQRCDADYVGFTSRLLHQCVEEHKQSTIGNHIKDEHGKEPKTITSNFKTLKKCQSQLDCGFWMLEIPMHQLRLLELENCQSLG